MEEEQTKTPEPQENKQEEVKQEVKTFTEEEVKKLLNTKIQSETDKVRTEYSKKLKDAETELSKYKPKQKTEAELELENRLKVLEDKEKEVSKKEKLLKISDELEKQGLPKQLAKYLQGAEDVETEINSLKEIFNTSKIDNSFKPSKHTSGKESITKEQFLKMNYADRVNLFKSNKELYERLSK